MIVARSIVYILEEIMLFKQNIHPSCSYCLYGTDLGYNEIACIKRGIMSAVGFCNAFRYEPTKRVPEFAQNVSISRMKEEDFAI